MASIPDLKSDLNKDRILETAKEILVTKKTVTYGSSVYQVRNITGFKAGKIPKEKFPFQSVIGLVAVGVVLISFTAWGWLLLILAGFLIYQHFSQTQYYGLSIFLNSGKELFFRSPDQTFVDKAVAQVYRLMEGQLEGSVKIDILNTDAHYHEGPTITAGGNITGLAIGNENTVDIKQE